MQALDIAHYAKLSNGVVGLIDGRLLLNNMTKDNIQPKNTSLEDTKF